MTGQFRNNKNLSFPLLQNLFGYFISGNNYICMDNIFDCYYLKLIVCISSDKLILKLMFTYMKHKRNVKISKETEQQSLEIKENEFGFCPGIIKGNTQMCGWQYQLIVNKTLKHKN